MTKYANKGFYSQQGTVNVLLLAKILLGLLLLAWVALSIHQLSVFLLSQQAAPKSSFSLEAQSSSTADETTKYQVNIKELAAIPLFGEVVIERAPVIEEPPEEVEEPIVETKLNLSLKGLFTSEGDQPGRAIIANGRQEALYREGDEIEGLSNVKLLVVYSDRIKLDNRGNPELLYLYPEGERLASGQPSAFVQNESSQPQLASVQSDTSTGIVTVPVQPKVKRLSEIIRVVRERDKETGNMLGFRVLPGRDRESFERSGLQVNDVITTIDGQQLTDLSTAMAIYRENRDKTQVSLIVRRGQDDISLDIDLNQLNL